MGSYLYGQNVEELKLRRVAGARCNAFLHTSRNAEVRTRLGSVFHTAHLTVQLGTVLSKAQCEGHVY